MLVVALLPQQENRSPDGLRMFGVATTTKERAILQTDTVLPSVPRRKLAVKPAAPSSSNLRRRKVACVDESQKSAIKDFELRGYDVQTIPKKPMVSAVKKCNTILFAY